MSDYNPLPWQIAPLNDRRRILLLAGAAGGGKSRVAAEKVHAYLMHYPGATGLVLRKTYASMLNSTVLFLQNEIIGENSGIKHLGYQQRFQYPNGSVLAYGGMANAQQREAIRGVGAKGGVDIAWLEEATQFAESDFDEVLFRLRGRAAPWRQVLLTTNPGGPQHWINLRLILGGGAILYESKAADNTHNPDDYMDTMQRTTGVERKRLLEGQWAQGGDLVYDMWRDGGPDSHVTEEAEYVAGSGIVYWAVDDGWAGRIDETSGLFKAGSHPRVILPAQLRGGILNVFDESYRIKTKAPEQIADVLARDYPEPEVSVVDKSAASLKGELHEGNWGEARWYLHTANGPNRIEESMKEVREWLLPDARGVSRVRVHPRCTFLRSEMASYGNDPTTGKPIKDFDHGPDALRYLIWYLRVH